MFRPRNGTHYWHRTKAGVFEIRIGPKGWMLVFAGEVFDGPFADAMGALGDLVGGHCYTPSCGDTYKLGIPDDLSDWHSER